MSDDANEGGLFACTITLNEKVAVAMPSESVTSSVVDPAGVAATGAIVSVEPDRVMKEGRVERVL